jgi:cell division control protein 6
MSVYPSGATSVTVDQTVEYHPSNIFRDKRVFHLEYVPDHIVHRDSQVSAIRRILADMENGVRPYHILGMGAYGTGKTAVVRSTCRNLGDGIRVVYVNCSEDNTQIEIYRQILTQLGIPTSTGFRVNYYLDLFKKTIAPLRFLLLILDEVDKFVERKDSDAESLFYTLSRSVFNVVVIMLTNHASLESRLRTTLDSRVIDTFQWQRIEFSDYKAAELGEILEDRCMIGLREGTYDLGIAIMIAKKAYDKGLRARGVMKLARIAGEIAEENNHDAILEEDVRQAALNVTQEQEMAIIRDLPPPQRAILAHVLTNSPTNPEGEAWWAEWAPKHDLGPSRTRYQGYVKDLETQALINKTIRSLGRGRGHLTVLSVPPDLVSIVEASLRASEETPATPTDNRTEKP